MRILFLIILVWSISFCASAQLENLGKTVNTEYNEISPIISPDGKTVYFSRISHPQNTHGPKGSQDIWFSELKNDKWTQARRLPPPLNKEDYNSLYSITPDGNTLLVKGSYKNGVYETRGFSTSKKTARGWSAPNKIELPGYSKISKGQFDCGYLSTDGKALVMSFSEKKNSKTDDMYVSFKQKNGEWSKPLNLGPEINTEEFTETTPFLAPDGVTIYFSSDRKGGQGSNDIYYSKRIDKSWKRWSRPVNLGAAINSDGYDAYYTISALGDYAYMVSFKDTEGKGDVVRYNLRPKPAPGDTTEAPVANIPTADPVVMISGKVIDSKTGKPIEATIIYENLADGEEVGTATTNPTTGEYKIVLPYGQKYSWRAVAPNFIAEGENIDLSDSTESGKDKGFREITNKLLKLIPIEEGQIVRLNNIFFATGKSALSNESFPELNRIAISMSENKTLTIELGGHTDNTGSAEFNLKLSQDRADSVREYLIGKGTEPDRVASKGYGETVPVAKNDTPEGQQQNRRVEFKILKK
ncbi:OmpA family protein [Dyadobacter arcticus]|uniref:Outer membrane protein OmpA-like peptidoglycan-associated protein/Tol biopolymer transport system component n=1 Tax=Dyadobacter arcticus TaxID=1078754 RepID=A0ABX0UTL6_9BACT|nr:OmpA family protein [Dyadobacter arcticus]NIJ55574.1 outer membrane protein OmpA-like peptidoglycan-associated protein/Tol biopolymer transport system component [Dyadobacter arcticus]